MRLALHGANPLEWLLLRLGVVPTPAAEAWGGMATSGVLVAAVRTGIAERLAKGPASSDAIAHDLGLEPVPTRLLLECLRSGGQVSRRHGRYALRRGSRRWLDPHADLSVANFIAATGDYFSWWQGLDEVTRTGKPLALHDLPHDDPYWRRYILGQLDLATLSASEVSAKIRLPSNARRLLDVGGGHGWYSAALCRRHPGLTATVLDLPGSTAIGREVIEASGLSEQVRHLDGDALSADLGEGYDAVLCFNLVHHLGPEQIPKLFARLYEALSPWGTLAVLDAFAEPERRGSAAADYLGLFMYLSSGSQVYTKTQLDDWLREAGFTKPRRVRVLRIPGLALYQAGKR
jgi:hypothetical protein